MRQEDVNRVYKEIGTNLKKEMDASFKKIRDRETR